MLNFMLVVPCAKLLKLLNNMLSNRFFQVFLGVKSNRWRSIKNELRPGKFNDDLERDTFVNGVYNRVQQRLKHVSSISMLDVSAETLDER
jgi:hypothetical protein